MAHECEICGSECFCDQEDHGGLEQPLDCPHFDMHADEDGFEFEVYQE